MAVNFPDNPSNGDSFTSNGIVYVYNSTTTAWQKSYTSVPPVVTGHVLPDANETYDLGSTTQRFRDLYLSGNSITIGDLVISDNNGVFEVTPSGGSAVSFATQADINSAISSLVDTAPGTLDTLNELAAALGDDANFATNITASLANKLEASDLTGYATQNDLNAKQSVITAGNGIILAQGVTLTGTTYDSKTVSVSSQDANPEGLIFNSTGTKMIHGGATNKKFYEYTLSTAFDISTASFDRDFSVSSQVSSVGSMHIDDTGIYAIVMDGSNKQIKQYTMSSAFDLSTMSYTRSVQLPNGSSERYEAANPRYVHYVDSGNKVGIWLSSGSTIYYDIYDLSSAYDISGVTGNPDASSSDLDSTYTSPPRHSQWSSDGKTLWTIQYNYSAADDGLILQHAVTTAFDATTITVSSEASFDTLAQSISPSPEATTAFYIDENQSKLYVLNVLQDSIHQFTMGGGSGTTLSVDSTIATLSGTETLSNKTLAATTLAGHIIPNSDSAYDLGSLTNRFRDLYLSGNTLYIGDVELSVNNEGLLQLPSGSLIDGAVVPTEIGQMTNVRLEPNPEVLEMAVDSPTAGHASPWLWSWKSGALPYARTTITNQVQSDVPIYIDGTYTLFNFAAHELHGTMTQTHKIYLKWIEGAGLDNLVSWATSTLNVQNIIFEGVNGDSATEVQRLNISVPSTITLPTLVAPNLTYDVSFANAGAYTFGGIASGDNPDIGPLYRGGTYTFNLDASISGHPFYLTQDDGTNWSQGQYIDEYTNGVTGSRNDSGTVVFTIPNDAPDILYYQCGNHSSMRGMLTIKNLEVETNGTGNYIVYFQHDQEEHSVPVEIRQRPSIAGQSCLVYDSSLSEFVPQDMGDYITKTPVIQERIGELAEDKIVEKVNDDTVTNLTKVKEQTTFTTNLNQQGELQLVTGTARWYAPFDLLVTGINTKVSSAADANISIEIKKNGTVVKSDSILAGQFSSVVSAPEFSMAEGDYITVDVTSIGTTNKGEDLVVQFKYRQT